MLINTSEVSFKSDNDSIKLKHAIESVKFLIDNPISKPNSISPQKSEFKDTTQNSTSEKENINLATKKKLLNQILTEVYNNEFDSIYSQRLNPAEQKSINDNNIEANLRASYESQDLSPISNISQYSANGIINTLDKKEIGFTLSMNIEYENSRLANLPQFNFVTHNKLIIDFDDYAEGIINSTLKFELQKDGLLQKLPFLKDGEGVLTIGSEEQTINIPQYVNSDGTNNLSKSLNNVANREQTANLQHYTNHLNISNSMPVNTEKVDSYNGFNLLASKKYKNTEQGIIESEVKSSTLLINNEHQVMAIQQLDFLL
ncbi:MAG TPA: hypothetical protein PLE30_06145 [Candidatus Kapabacteria bacterium]|nr:hypothetical protein [Candidatus Kapabacteria bacterium]